MFAAKALRLLHHGQRHAGLAAVMNGLGDDAPGVEGGAPTDTRLAPKHRLESVLVEVVLYVRRGQLGQPVPFTLPLEQERAELAYLAPASSPSVSRCHSMPKSRATLMRGA